MKLLSTLVLMNLLYCSCGTRDENSSDISSDAIGRRVFASARPYQALQLDPSERERMSQSFGTMRQLGWQVFRQVLQPQGFQSILKSGEQVFGTLPLFMSWYTIEDIQRYYRYALQQTASTDLEKNLSDSLLFAAENYLNHELDELPSALGDRLRRWLQQHPQAQLEDWMGLGGISRIYYSPDLVRGLLKQHRYISNCYRGARRPAARESKISCWPDTLPDTSALVKAAWINAKAPFYSYATDAASLRDLMSTAHGSWQSLAKIRPAPEVILAARLGEERLLLPALHIMSRDRNDWLWLTAFWSDTPDLDFGADRPAEVTALGPPFDRYKICVVASFQDEARDLDALADHQPDLVAAYRAAQLASPGSSWCSNPYLEAGTDNHRSNCIGCHQFAGTAVDSETILGDQEQFPDFGNRKQRENFPVDYMWSVAMGQNSVFNMTSSLLEWRRSQDNK